MASTELGRYFVKIHDATPVWPYKQAEVCFREYASGEVTIVCQFPPRLSRRRALKQAQTYADHLAKTWRAVARGETQWES